MKLSSRRTGYQCGMAEGPDHVHHAGCLEAVETGETVRAADVKPGMVLDRHGCRVAVAHVAGGDSYSITWEDGQTWIPLPADHRFAIVGAQLSLAGAGGAQ